MIYTDIRLMDIVEMKKKHPCGGNTWTVIRVGADIKLKCNTCERVIMLDRVELNKRFKKLISKGEKPQGNSVEFI